VPFVRLAEAEDPVYPFVICVDFRWVLVGIEHFLEYEVVELDYGWSAVWSVLYLHEQSFTYKTILEKMPYRKESQSPQRLQEKCPAPKTAHLVLIDISQLLEKLNIRHNELRILHQRLLKCGFVLKTGPLGGLNLMQLATCRPRAVADEVERACRLGCHIASSLFQILVIS
jgi:hypothetical protein